MKRLDKATEEIGFELAIQGKELDEISTALGFRNRRSFAHYRRQYPDFEIELDRAMNDYCLYLEQKMLNVCNDWNDKYARVQLEAISKVLKYRNPKRYGDKQQIDITQTIDISGSLAKAERRVLEAGLNTDHIGGAVVLSIQDGAPKAD